MQMKKQTYSEDGQELAKQGASNGSEHVTGRAPDDLGVSDDKLDTVYNLPVTSDRTAKWQVTHACHRVIALRDRAACAVA